MSRNSYAVRAGRAVDLAVVAMLGMLVLLLGAAPARVVEVRAREFAFEPKEITVRPGEITFVVHNDGVIEHNFFIEDGARRTVGEIAVIPPGKAEELQVRLRAGTYQIVCTLPGHKDAGIVGTLRVAP